MAVVNKYIFDGIDADLRGSSLMSEGAIDGVLPLGMGRVMRSPASARYPAGDFFFRRANKP